MISFLRCLGLGAKIQVASSQVFIVRVVEKRWTAPTIKEEYKELELDELLPDDI